MTQNDIKQIDGLIKENLKGVATKKDLKRFATKGDLKDLRKELKEDIETAVVQIVGAVDNVVGKLTRRVDRIEEHLELPPLE